MSKVTKPFKIEEPYFYKHPDYVRIDKKKKKSSAPTVPKVSEEIAKRRKLFASRKSHRHTSAIKPLYEVPLEQQISTPSKYWWYIPDKKKHKPNIFNAKSQPSEMAQFNGNAPTAKPKVSFLQSYNPASAQKAVNYANVKGNIRTNPYNPFANNAYQNSFSAVHPINTMNEYNRYNMNTNRNVRTTPYHGYANNAYQNSFNTMNEYNRYNMNTNTNVQTAPCYGYPNNAYQNSFSKVSPINTMNGYAVNNMTTPYYGYNALQANMAANPLNEVDKISGMNALYGIDAVSKYNLSHGKYSNRKKLRNPFGGRNYSKIYPRYLARFEQNATKKFNKKKFI